MENFVNSEKLITQTEYAKLRNCTPQMVTKLIKKEKVTVLNIKGARLIMLD